MIRPHRVTCEPIDDFVLHLSVDGEPSFDTTVNVVPPLAERIDVIALRRAEVVILRGFTVYGRPIPPVPHPWWTPIVKVTLPMLCQQVTAEHVEVLI